ncbi:hypothetical protein Adt_35527 [Abeliophyllum distichum]|uniref:Uncharacterized protein n=1 Tax=Abeliophyllum distichum TaxID=126358 RepID=A0ABD1QIZ9_9LAMI
MATANSTLNAMVVKKEKLLAKAKEEIERVKTDHADVEAKVVAAYHDGFEDTSKYKDLAHHFMTAGGEQLVERITETHLEWYISFLRSQDVGEAQILTPTTEEGP